MTQAIHETLDIEGIENAVVRARMWLHFLRSDKGPLVARKVFCLGGAKTGTSSLHALFEENGLKSQHASGDWMVAAYDCFSDRGDYRPFRAYAQSFPEAVFVLNTRGLRGYLSSYASHLQRNTDPATRKALPVQYFINRTLRRNRHMARVLSFFSGDQTGADRLLLINIDRPDAMNFIASRLHLAPPSQAHRHRSQRALLAGNEANIDAALARMGLTGRENEPLVLPELLTPRERAKLAFRLPKPENCLL